MRKETLITLTRKELLARHARELAWWDAAHAEKTTTRKNTTSATAKTTPKKTTPRAKTTPARRTPTTAANVDSRMSELRARFGLDAGEDLAWDDLDILEVVAG